MSDATGVGPIQRDVLRVSGPDALSFLQGQLSQDIVGLAVGSSAWSLLLSPKGKVDAWMRVTRTAEDAVLIDTDPGVGAAIDTRLNRFKLRTDCVIESLDWSVVAVRGDDAESLRASVTPPAVIAELEWPGEIGFDVLSPEPVAIGGSELSPGDLEQLRVSAGRPRAGAEISAEAIPAEFGEDFVNRSVSFTKGCYVGQELVARMASRGGSAPKRMVRAHGSGAGPEVGAVIVFEEAEKGTITSVARAGAPVGGNSGDGQPDPSGRSGWQALAVVHRSVPVPAVIRVDGHEVHLEPIA